MSDECTANRFEPLPELTLEGIEAALTALGPPRKWEIRLHPEDELEFLEWAYRAWPAGKEIVAGVLVRDGDHPLTVSLTRLQELLRPLLVLSEFQPRGKAALCHWVFRVPRWLTFEPRLPIGIGERVGPKVWEIEKIEILSFREEVDAP